MNEMRIATLRRERGWTQERLAETSGIAVRTVQRLERGNEASLETLSAIARALDVPVRELFAAEAAAAAAASEQAARDRFVAGFWSMSTALGVLFGIVTVVLLVLHVWSALVFLLVGAYWAVRYPVGRFLLDTVMGPRLDRRWPLSHASGAPVRAAR